jgi:hypothetical protein
VLTQHIGSLIFESQNGTKALGEGAIAGRPFHVQPAVLVPAFTRGADPPFISVMFHNNPACSALAGNATAPIGSDGVAEFTDLAVGAPGRDYALRFCLGACFGSLLDVGKAASDVATPLFSARYGQLVLAQGCGGAIAGVPFAQQPELRVESVLQGQFTLAIGYNFGVTAHFFQGPLKGRRTQWARQGIVRFTDLRLDEARGEGNTIFFTSCAGTPAGECLEGTPEAMTAVTPPFGVFHGPPAFGTIVGQPVRSRAGWPIGSTCANRVGSVCREIVVTNPPRVELSDAFGNLVLTGDYVACTELQNAKGQELQGDTSVRLIRGAATFSNISLPLQGVGYRLAFTFVRYGAQCGDVDALVGSGGTSEEFSIVYGEISTITVVNQPVGTAGPGGVDAPLATQPAISFSDTFGNLVTTADGLRVKVPPPWY